jgi:hypothetical protein
MLRTVRSLAPLLIAFMVYAHKAVAETDGHARYRALLNNNQLVEVWNAHLSKDTLTGTLTNGQSTSVPIKSLQSLDRSSGTYAGKGALIGSTTGFLLGLCYVLITENRTATSSPSTDDGVITMEDVGRIAVPMAGCTATGALIGVMVGSGLPRWEKVPLPLSFGFSPKTGSIEFRLNFGM